MKHIFKEGAKDHPVYLLFHGTGGNEEDLIPIVEHLDPKASILSFQGDVNEQGMLRFFKRLAMGILDEEDLKLRAEAMKIRLEDLYETYQLHDHIKIALGYSNGANLIAGMLYLNLAPFDAASLHHPMKPFKQLTPTELPPLKVMIHAGKYDSICPYDHVIDLKQALSTAGAHVTVYDYEGGHAITQEELKETAQAMKEVRKVL